jgi:hypothetical protein
MALQLYKEFNFQDETLGKIDIMNGIVREYIAQGFRLTVRQLYYLSERIEMFTDNTPVEFVRIALNLDQVKAQRPPPNPAKSTDSRFQDYRNKFGDQSWELDALSPDYLAKLVRRHAQSYIDQDVWDERTEEINGIKKRLAEVAETF